MFDSPLERTWFFYKEGCVIPKSAAVEKLRSGYFRELEFFVVPKNGHFCYEYFEDDGQSFESDVSHNIWAIDVEYDSNKRTGRVMLTCKHLGDSSSLDSRTFHILFPEGFSGGISVPAGEADGTEIGFGGEYR